MTDCFKKIINLQVLKLIDCVHQSDFKSIDHLSKNNLQKILNYSDPYQGKTALITSVLIGDHDMARYLLKLGSDPDAVDFQKLSPLMIACQLGDFQMVEILCLSKSNLNLIDSYLKTALLHCFESDSENNLKCLEILLKYGADCNLKIAGKTAFLMACERSNSIEKSCIWLALKGKVDINLNDENNGNYALHYSAINGSLELCYVLLKSGSNPNCQNFLKQTPSHFAAHYKHIDILKILWSFGANFEETDLNEDNTMNYAFKQFYFNNIKENLKVAKFLCRRGALPFDKNSKSRLLPTNKKFEKCKIKIHNITRKIQQKYSNFYSIDESSLELKNEYFRYWMLRIHDTFTTVYKLIEDIYENLMGKIKTIDKEIFLHFLGNVNTKIPHLIFDRLFDLISNNSSLVRAQIFDLKIYKALSAFNFNLEKGLKLKPIRNSNKNLKTDSNKKSSKFFIPKQNIDLKASHYQSKYPKCIDSLRFSDNLLFEKAWSNDSKWYLIPEKKTKLELNNIVNRGDIETLRNIFSKKTALEAKKLANLKDMFYKTPLMIAILRENEKMIDFLLEYDIDINSMDNFKWTALHHSVMTGNLNIVKKLTEKKICIKMKNIGGRTALDLAIILNKKSIENFLKNLN